MSNKKVVKWLLLGLAAAVIVAGVPVSEVFADRGERHHEQWERGSKDDMKVPERMPAITSSAVTSPAKAPTYGVLARGNHSKYPDLRKRCSH